MRRGLYSCTLPLIQHFLGSKWKRGWSQFECKPSTARALMGLINPQRVWFVFYSWVNNFISTDEFKLRSGRSSSVTLQQPTQPELISLTLKTTTPHSAPAFLRHIAIKIKQLREELYPSPLTCMLRVFFFFFFNSVPSSCAFGNVGQV